MAKRVSKDLEALKERVVEWRSKKKRGSRIPEELWSEAVAVARREGVSPTSRVTGFAYGDLKKRVAECVRAPKASMPPSFVAIEVPPTATDSRVAVELTRADGSKMRIETDAGQLNVRDMVESFLRTIG